MSSQYLDACVLVIDDSRFSRQIVTQMLQEHGIENIVHAENGEEGMAMSLRYQPDLIISDLMMPVMDGYEFCAHLRGNKDFASTPVIIQTGIDDPAKRAQAFAVGATDVVQKPLNAEELIARTLIHLKSKALLSNLRAHNERMELELATAQSMQYDLLPSETDLLDIRKHLPFHIAAHFEGSSELSGDFWGCTALNNHQLAVYLVDFTGHGIKAALNTFRLHAMLHTEFFPEANPGAYLTKLNQRLNGLLQSGNFATMFYAVIDSETEEIHYATAASPNPVRMPATGEPVHMIDGSGLPLGVFPDITYETQTMPFAKGDALILYSDALIESQNAKGDFFDEDDLMHYCSKLQEKRMGTCVAESECGIVEPDLMCQSLLRRLYEHTAGIPIEDDLTLAVVSHAGEWRRPS